MVVEAVPFGLFGVGKSVGSGWMLALEMVPYCSVLCGLEQFTVDLL